VIFVFIFDFDQCANHFRPLPCRIAQEEGLNDENWIDCVRRSGGCLAGPGASAQQVLNLSGQFRCVQGCLGPGPAYVTQNGWDMNLVNEVGQPSRAWIDYPGHIWAEYWNEGAVYSPDGMVIQFDRGSVWVRNLAPPPPPPPARVRG
jgi:hypothetical protein